MSTFAERRSAFRSLHEQGFFIIPNAWDAGSTIRLERLGFKAIASTSAGAAWAIGKEDGELTLDEALANLCLLVGATGLPINADFENGYADEPEAVALNVVKAVETGVAGLSIEDWSGTGFYETGLASDRIAAARAAIDSVDPSVVLVGRSEHYHDKSKPVSETIARAVAYAEAGADVIFTPGVADHGAIAELIAAVAPKPVNVVVSAYDEIPKLAQLGVRRVSVGGGLAYAAYSAFDRAAAELRASAPNLRQV